MKPIIFSENVIRLMRQKDLSQQQLASMIDIQRKVIAKVSSPANDLNNTTSIKLSSAISIANGLDAYFPDLFSRINDTELTHSSHNLTASEYLEIFIINSKVALNGRAQKSLSFQGGVSESTISEILSGKVSDPYLSSLEDISNSLHINLPKMFKI